MQPESFNKKVRVGMIAISLLMVLGNLTGLFLSPMILASILPVPRGYYEILNQAIICKL
jgi:hypothetical protein